MYSNSSASTNSTYNYYNQVVSPTDTINSESGTQTPKFTYILPVLSRNNSEEELTYFVNRKDGLPKVIREFKKEEKDKKPGWNSLVKLTDKTKIDTNMVKLKLLDFTRKAIIEKSRKPCTSNETQTEPMQTLMIKDAKTGIQDDLLMYADKSTETKHGELAIIVQKKILLMTHSIALNTDTFQTKEMGIQTELPQSLIKFHQFIEPNTPYELNFPNLSREDFNSNSESCKINLETKEKLQQPDIILGATSGLEFPNNDFRFGQRFLNVHFSKILSNSEAQREIWTDSQIKLVYGLMAEVESFLRLFDQMAILLGPDFQFRHKYESDENFVMPDSKYKAKFATYCRKIEDNLEKLDNLQKRDA